jgi:hypothetical protein
MSDIITGLNGLDFLIYSYANFFAFSKIEDIDF